MRKFGDVVITYIPFVDSSEIKVRPALVLYEELGNIVVAGVTSNTTMQGIPLLKSEGAIKDSVVKLNYIFTVSNTMIKKFLFSVSEQKKNIIRQEFMKRVAA